MIVSVTDGRVLSDPSLQSFSYHEHFLDFFLNLRQIGIFSRIMTPNAFVLHSWMIFWLCFLRFDFELFQMNMHYYLISIDSYFSSIQKHMIQHYSSNTANAYIPIALIELFPHPFSTSGAHWIIFFGHPSHSLAVKPFFSHPSPLLVVEPIHWTFSPAIY